MGLDNLDLNKKSSKLVPSSNSQVDKMLEKKKNNYVKKKQEEFYTEEAKKVETQFKLENYSTINEAKKDLENLPEPIKNKVNIDIDALNANRLKAYEDRIKYLDKRIERVGDKLRDEDDQHSRYYLKAKRVGYTKEQEIIKEYLEKAKKGNIYNRNEIFKYADKVGDYERDRRQNKYDRKEREEKELNKIRNNLSVWGQTYKGGSGKYYDYKGNELIKNSSGKLVYKDINKGLKAQHDINQRGYNESISKINKAADRNLNQDLNYKTETIYMSKLQYDINKDNKKFNEDLYNKLNSKQSSKVIHNNLDNVSKFAIGLREQNKPMSIVPDYHNKFSTIMTMNENDYNAYKNNQFEIKEFHKIKNKDIVKITPSKIKLSASVDDLMSKPLLDVTERNVEIVNKPVEETSVYIGTKNYDKKERARYLADYERTKDEKAQTELKLNNWRKAHPLDRDDKVGKQLETKLQELNSKLLLNPYVNPDTLEFDNEKYYRIDKEPIKEEKKIDIEKEITKNVLNDLNEKTNKVRDIQNFKTFPENPGEKLIEDFVGGFTELTMSAGKGGWKTLKTSYETTGENKFTKEDYEKLNKLNVNERATERARLIKKYQEQEFKKLEKDKDYKTFETALGIGAVAMTGGALAGAGGVAGTIGEGINLGLEGLGVYYAGEEAINFIENPSVKNLGKTTFAGLIGLGAVKGIKEKADFTYNRAMDKVSDSRPWVVEKELVRDEIHKGKGNIQYIAKYKGDTFERGGKTYGVRRVKKLSWKNPNTWVDKIKGRKPGQIKYFDTTAGDILLADVPSEFATPKMEANIGGKVQRMFSASQDISFAKPGKTYDVLPFGGGKIETLKGRQGAGGIEAGQFNAPETLRNIPTKEGAFKGQQAYTYYAKVGKADFSDVMSGKAKFKLFGKKNEGGLIATQEYIEPVTKSQMSKDYMDLTAELGYKPGTPKLSASTLKGVRTESEVIFPQYSKIEITRELDTLNLPGGDRLKVVQGKMKPLTKTETIEGLNKNIAYLENERIPQLEEIKTKAEDKWKILIEEIRGGLETQGVTEQSLPYKIKDLEREKQYYANDKKKVKEIDNQIKELQELDSKVKEKKKAYEEVKNARELIKRDEGIKAQLKKEIEKSKKKHYTEFEGNKKTTTIPDELRTKNNEIKIKERKPIKEKVSKSNNINEKIQSMKMKERINKDLELFNKEKELFDKYSKSDNRPVYYGSDLMKDLSKSMNKFLPSKKRSIVNDSKLGKSMLKTNISPLKKGFSMSESSNSSSKRFKFNYSFSKGGGDYSEQVSFSDSSKKGGSSFTPSSNYSKLNYSEFSINSKDINLNYKPTVLDKFVNKNSKKQGIHMKHKSLMTDKLNKFTNAFSKGLKDKWRKVL